MAATLAESRRLSNDGIKRLKAERAALERQRRADDAELRRLTTAGGEDGDLARLAQVQDRTDPTERRRCEIEHELATLVAQDISEQQVAAALGEFDTVWAALAPREQARVLAALIDRIDHDGKAGNIEITFHPTGMKALAEQGSGKETAA